MLMMMQAQWQQHAAKNAQGIAAPPLIRGGGQSYTPVRHFPPPLFTLLFIHPKCTLQKRKSKHMPQRPEKKIQKCLSGS
jgi:hypothetical protein